MARDHLGLTFIVLLPITEKHHSLRPQILQPDSHLNPSCATYKLGDLGEVI